jgi:hypothetical protein
MQVCNFLSQFGFSVLQCDQFRYNEQIKNKFTRFSHVIFCVVFLLYMKNQKAIYER